MFESCHHYKNLPIMSAGIETKIRLNQTVDVIFDIDEIVDAINRLPVTRRWNTIAGMLNYVNFNEEELTPEQKKITVEWLEKKLEKFRE